MRLIALLLILLTCAPAAEESKTYENSLLSFRYPADWDLVKDPRGFLVLSRIMSPNTPGVSIALFPAVGKDHAAAHRYALQKFQESLGGGFRESAAREVHYRAGTMLETELTGSGEEKQLFSSFLLDGKLWVLSCSETRDAANITVARQIAASVRLKTNR